MQRPNPAGGEGPPRQGPGTPEQDVDVAPRNRFPSLEALAPATSPLPEAQPSPVPAAPSTERPRPRTPEWYAAKWAAEREALERRRYQGYFESQRAWYEERRREDFAARLRRSASGYLDRARWLKRQAREFVQAGRTLRAEHMFKASGVAERDSYEFGDSAEAVLAGRVVPDEVFIDNPADFQRINDDVADLALGAVETSDRSALTGADDDPPPIDRSRRYGQWGGLRPPLALHQTDLERQIPRHPDGNVVRTADPRQGGWFALANDGGPQADPTRGINCLDCTLSLFETWVHGRPRVSAPRTFDGYAAGDIRCPIMGEKNGPRRVEQVTGGRFQKLVGRREAATDSPTLRDAVDRGFENLRVQLKIGGHGSYAFLITEWENGGSHAWVALNQNGTILYLDPQSGAVHDQPLYRHQGVADPDNVISVDALVLGGDGRPMPLGGLARGQFSVLPDLPDHPSTPEDEAGYGDPYLNRLHLLDGPSGADSTGTSQGAGSEAALSPPVSPEETADPMAQLSAVDRNVLNGLRRRAESVADAVEACLAAVCDRVTAVLGGDRVVTMRDQEFRLKSSHSLARKFLDEAVALGMTAEDFTNEVNDVLRFCLVLPAADHYATAVGQVLNELRRDGFHVEDQSCKNFWRVGNRFYGFNCTVRSPAGQVFELQLHTESSRAAWLGTHHAYEVLRRSDSPAVDRLEALLEMLAVNKRAGLPDEIPSELESRFPTKDGSFAKWITAYPATWLAYRRALEVEGLSLADVAHRLGLTRLDFPITPELERRMEQASVDLLRSVP
ncbi:toxin glutamine deamidase domain-containing protein [Micromonospora purpureochromogenes]|uniref:toxin glutamine deamidase domain-containing protein n=1 Tax=Micromonospora purpureochromogenes TaxID=47872 RepID=UPI003321C1CF